MTHSRLAPPLFLIVSLAIACESSPRRRRPSSTDNLDASSMGGAGGRGGTGGGATGGSGGSMSGTGGTGGGGTAGSDGGGLGGTGGLPGSDAAVDSAPSLDVAAKRDTNTADLKPATDVAALPATFANVKALLIEKCAGCHDPDHDNTVDLLTDANFYQRLVNVKPTYAKITACRTQTLVVPSKPETSLLYQKMLPAGARNGCGMRMPLEETGNDCARIEGYCPTDAQLTMVETWIRNGARQ